MNDARATRPRWWHKLLVRRFFTPRGFLVTAVDIAAIFAVLHLAGLRRYTSILIGALASGQLADRWACGLGFLYVVWHFLFLLGAPILLLAAAIFKAILLLGRVRPSMAHQGGSAPARQPS